MESKEVLQNADVLQSEADEIIKVTDIAGSLANLGGVDFVGSYAMGLLYHPDIDIHVSSTDCSFDKAIEQTKRFLDTKVYATVKFVNCSDYPCVQEYLKGYYWNLKSQGKNRMWKMDIWYNLPEYNIGVEKTRKINEKLAENPSAREKILLLKDSLYLKGGKYKNNMGGFKIYKEVLGKID